MSKLKSKEFRILLLLSLATLLVGTLFYHSAENWTWVDSFYFSSITLTTVGYGDLYPTTDLSKIFTVLYAILGIGILFSFINFWATKRINGIQRRRK